MNVEQSNTFNEPSLNLAATSFNFASVPAAAALPKVVKATDPSYKVEPNLPDQSVSIAFDSAIWSKQYSKYGCQLIFEETTNVFGHSFSVEPLYETFGIFFCSHAVGAPIESAC